MDNFAKYKKRRETFSRLFVPVQQRHSREKINFRQIKDSKVNHPSDI